MSEWRQRGYVQDSDEEEDESQIESQNSKQCERFGRRVERVRELSDAEITDGEGAAQAQEALVWADVAANELSGALRAEAANGAAQRYAVPRRPSLSPFTPASQRTSRQERCESPDPLQNSPTAKIRSPRPPRSSQSHRSPTHQQSSQEEIQLRAYALPSQILGETTQPIPEPHRDGGLKKVNASAILGEFGVAALSDNSEDELNQRQESDEESKLSDYPSDLSDTELVSPIAYATPHRRTAVQVVIPSSTALLHQLAEEEARQRSFRQRKPIQLHPYMLEGERYRREVQSRGLKPVPRARSPIRRQGHANDAESQEEEFNPFGNDSSSPPDPEIFASTPVAQQTKSAIGQRSGSNKRGPLRSQHGSPAVQLRVPKPAKRRRLNETLSQALATPARTSESSPVPLDIWSIPPNSPPYSSSPPRDARSGNLFPTRNTDSLPTPSNSSTFHDEPQTLADSDSDPVLRSAQRSGGELRRPVRIILSDEAASDSDGASTASAQGDGELQQVGKRIRGVLPASWLRFDRQAQERRLALARQRVQQDEVQSPGPTRPQRGVAQKIIRPSGRSFGQARGRPHQESVVVISDESEQEPEQPSSHRRATDVQDTVDEASALAILLDDRYANSDDDLASMEHDRLQLSMLGSSGPKRKRQPKITDAFGNTKRMRRSRATGAHKASHLSKLASGFSTRGKQPGSRRTRTPPPALSVIDIELPPHVPDFLKLARRAARRDVDHARQSPRRKQIRLHTAQDTDDANAALRQWREGLLEPRTKHKIDLNRSNRQPLTDKTENRQQALRSGNLNQTDEGDTVTLNNPKLSSRGRKPMPPSLRMLQRSSTPVSKPSRSIKIVKALKRSEKYASQRPAPLRTAQLESDEQQFGSSHRKIAFQKGLQRAEQLSDKPRGADRHFLNPQLARFLAEDGDVLPPLPTAKDVGEHEEVSPERSSNLNFMLKQCLRRKPQAIRMDVDAREYRQPSEPTFEPTISAPIVVSTEPVPTGQDGKILLGLGPSGTRYPVTFDVMPLKSDTYFHSDTFIGSEDLRRALRIGSLGARDLHEPAGYCTISHGLQAIRCGPWSDETYTGIAQMSASMLPPSNESLDESSTILSLVDALANLSATLRALAGYISEHLSFSDPIDREDFISKMGQLLQTLFDRLATIRYPDGDSELSLGQTQAANRALSYLLVIGVQVSQIASNTTTPASEVAKLISTIQNISQTVIKNIIEGIKLIRDFHERNKLHKVRENGIRGHDVLVESVVICMHTLELLNAPSLSFWDLVSHKLSLLLLSANHVQAFDNIWAIIFSLLPFTEFDLSGVPDPSRLRTFDKDNWGCLCTLLGRLLDFCPGTSRLRGSSINEYVRANFTRCYVLINDWHWKRCDQFLNVMFDYFGRNGLKPLRQETATGSAKFLQDYAAAGILDLVQNESAFHIALKCLATGLRGMADAYPEKKLRSFVFRRIPNHGRTCPKDQPLEEESLAALRNHHDLLSTLYCAVPSSCRPKLDRIRDLVSHETSHREACRVSVRAWANLTTFQLSTDEPYAAAKPFALWYKEITHQTLKQYRLAKSEADDYLKLVALDDTSKLAASMVKQTMERNQEQVIATLRDSIAGMKYAIQGARDQTSLTTFLADSDIVHLLELPHLDDRRLSNVIRETLSLLQQYASMQKPPAEQQVSQPQSEESQDYGDFPDLDGMDEWDNVVAMQTNGSATVPHTSHLNFIQEPLWRLMSNAFGAEHQPDDNLLLACVDSWIFVAGHAVSGGGKDWSCYIDSYSQVSWQQLRPTEQTRKYGPYFMASMIVRSPVAYKEHRQEFLTALLLSLADREAMLRFQHRLLDAILRVDEECPLLRNLPFFKTGGTGDWDISADNLRSRRLALISSLLANMREDVSATKVQEPGRLTQVKGTYGEMLMEFMTRLKSNYQHLQQGATIAGAYVEFVQKIVQFLKQYTSDICPVLTFFTDSVAFPLPTADPAYVVGRLCGYAPKVDDLRIAKELSSFIETITQQSAIDNQQVYLVDQLARALCTNEAPIADRMALRTIFLQGIFPAYIERALSSRVGYIIARPILQCLPTVLDKTIYDLTINHAESLSTAIVSIISLAHAFIRGTEQLKGDAQLLRQSHTMRGLVYMYDTVISMHRLLDYIVGRSVSITNNGRPSLVTYLEEFGGYITHMLDGAVPQHVPSYQGDADTASLKTQHADIMLFCARSLQSNMDANWSDDGSSIWFGQGQARKEVFYDMRSAESEKARLLSTLIRYHDIVNETFDDNAARAELVDDIIV